MVQKVLTLSAGGILTEITDAKQDALLGTGFVKSSAGTISYDTSTYLTTSAASSTYAPIASPVFSGSVVSGNYSANETLTIKAQNNGTADVLLQAANANNGVRFRYDNSAGAFTVSLFPNSSTPVSLFAIDASGGATQGNATFTGSIAAVKSGAYQAVFSGYSLVSNTSAAYNGYIKIGSNLTSSYVGLIDYNGDLGSTALTLTNTYANAAAAINFVANSIKVLSLTSGGSTFAGSVQSTTHKVTSTGGYISSDNSTGITTTVTTASLAGKTITIKDGIITGFA